MQMHLYFTYHPIYLKFPYVSWIFDIYWSVLKFSDMLMLHICECLLVSLCGNTKTEVEIIDELVSCLCYSYILSN